MELDGLVREVYQNIADEAIFEWLSANEACGQEEDELNYSVEKCLERAFDEVIGDSSHDPLSRQTVLLKLEAPENFIFTYDRIFLYENPSLISVRDHLDRLKINSSVCCYDGITTDDALQSLEMLVAFVSENYDFFPLTFLRLSDVRRYLTNP
ncbi:hypothetical protein RCL1_000449 [Eukaryota sp. TZLM3-RCL]